MVSVIKKQYVIVMRKKNLLTTRKKIRPSSRKWLERHINDPLVQRAQKEGLRSRAAYKLIEINEKFRILKPHQTVVDLGAAPGGWSIVAAKQSIRHTADGQKKGQIIALDILPFSPIADVMQITEDFTSINAEIQLIEALNNQKADVIMSDIAPNMTGNTITDRMRTELLTEYVLDFAIKTLTINGSLVVKIFQGGYSKEFKTIVEKHFSFLRHFKPQASRNQSAEIYLIAKKFHN